jgi:hypothetical protein
MWAGSHIKTCRDIFAYGFVQSVKVDFTHVEAHSLHAAADIHANHSGDDFIRYGHSSSDSTSHTGVNVRHNTDFTVGKCFLVTDRLNLLLCGFFQLRSIANSGVVLALYSNHNENLISTEIISRIISCLTMLCNPLWFQCVHTFFFNSFMKRSGCNKSNSNANLLVNC